MIGLAEATFQKTTRTQAKKKQREYEEAWRSKHGTNLHHEIAQVYRQLAMGHEVISVNKAMEIAGQRSNGEPVLAIAQADAKWAWYIYDGGMLTDADGNWRHQTVLFVDEHDQNPSKDKCLRYMQKRKARRFNRAFFPLRPSGRLIARVPCVPPHCLPAWPLRNYLILWEANWQESPKDPVLIRQIARDFYVVKAKWDMTEIERLALEMSMFDSNV